MQVKNQSANAHLVLHVSRNTVKHSEWNKGIQKRDVSISQCYGAKYFHRISVHFLFFWLRALVYSTMCRVDNSQVEEEAVPWNWALSIPAQQSVAYQHFQVVLPTFTPTGSEFSGVYSTALKSLPQQLLSYSVQGFLDSSYSSPC